MYRYKLRLIIFIFFLLPVAGLTAAEINCTSQLAYKPKNQQEKFKAAYCQYKSGEYEKALKTLRGLEKQLPLLADYVYYLEAGSYKNIGDIRQAEKKYNKILSKYPSSTLATDSLANLAEMYYSQGRYQDAIEIYRKIIEKEESKWNKAIYANEIGEILLEQGQVNEAFEIYKEIWVSYPQSTFSVKAKEIAKKTGLYLNPLMQRGWKGLITCMNLKAGAMLLMNTGSCPRTTI